MWIYEDHFFSLSLIWHATIYADWQEGVSALLCNTAAALAEVFAL